MRLNRYSLDAWRIERGLTITDLAAATGKDRTTVGKIIAGTRSATPAFINDAARALKVPKRALLEDPNAAGEDAA